MDMPIKLYRDTPITYDSRRLNNLEYVVEFNRLAMVEPHVFNPADGKYHDLLVLDTPIPNGVSLRAHMLFIPGDYVSVLIQINPKEPTYERYLCQVTRVANHVRSSPCDKQVAAIINQTLYLSIKKFLKGTETCIQI